MASIADATAPGAWPSALRRWPTGAKILTIISAALLPLAIIAVFATLQTSRMASVENRSRLRVAAAESSRALAIELIGDMTALRVAMKALEADPADAPSCARAQGVFAPQAPAGGRFVILDTRGRLLCGTAFPGAPTARVRSGDGLTASIVGDRGLVLTIGGDRRHTTGAVFFPRSFLGDISRPSAFSPDYAASLVAKDGRLPLVSLDDDGGLNRRQELRTELGLGALALEMEVRSPPITTPLIFALLLPLMMWIAAAAIAWFVVDRLLIRPLRQLRANVASYLPGEIIDAGELRALPAQEIRELGETFRAISRTVALHEAGLAEGLVRQTKLTREVHHRVKNNLQVISSLINIHARGSRTPEASAAYASIQRRVDALAVVHRNHYADVEENRGLNLRAVLGELASNIKAGAATGLGAEPGIALDAEAWLVSQDTAVALAFLVTETVELALSCDAAAQIRISIRPTEETGRAILRVSARALTESEALRGALAQRYGRVIEGLSRQLRAPLHHDPLAGAYEIAFPVLGRE